MTGLEYERWKDFALRMARVLYATNRRPSGQWIVDVVTDWFDTQVDGDEVLIGCIDNWDNSQEYPPDNVIQGPAPLVGDMVTTYLYNHAGYPPRCRACAIYEQEGECRCDEIEVLYYEQWDEQWGGPVHCCIRAGLDMAVAPSMGVVGFTAGDVRKMYPEGVPDWVFPPGERLYYWPGDELNGTFEELPDDAGVVL
jgi:hypothetical protein